MKPANFPARQLMRRKRAGEPVTDAQIALARGQRSKKTPRSAWTLERLARRRGK